MAVLEVINVKKTYWDNDLELRILQGVNLSLNDGDFVCISGQSGCGKSTLLHLLALLDKPDCGTIIIDGNNIDYNAKETYILRNKLIGFVFQFHYLIEDMTVIENVALPQLVAGKNLRESMSCAQKTLSILGIESRAGFYPYQLSGGEQQRVAIARAVINNPRILLADEPTGNLDPQHKDEVLDMIISLNMEFNSAIVLVTHDLSIAAKSRIHYRLENGVLYQVV